MAIYVVLLAASLMTMALPVPAVAEDSRAASDKERNTLLFGGRIAEAIFHEGRLWLRGSGVASIDLEQETSTVSFESDVIDMAMIGNDLWVLHGRAGQPDQAMLSVLTSGKFVLRARLDVREGEEPLALFDVDATPAVLTRKAILRLEHADKQIRRTILRGALREGYLTAYSPPESNVLFVGYNAGEWGGGLQRIDLATGTISVVESRALLETGESVLHKDLHPVTGLIHDQQNENCVLASIGLVHLSLSVGRIIRVCEDDVSVVFTRQTEVERFNQVKIKIDEAFFGLEAEQSTNGYWSASWRAIYNVRGDGATEYKMPRCNPLAGVYLSREIPGAIVVATDANWAYSTSGYTPLIVPLPGG